MSVQSSMRYFLLLMIGVGLLLSGCVKDPENAEEEIDTVELQFNNNGPTVKWTVGSTTTPEIVLEANQEYTANVKFLNEEEGEDVTVEVREEANEHLVCYELSGAANLTINISDTDGSLPLGLETQWTTGDASSGTLILKLRHQPGVKDGTCVPGESDVEVDFNITIQ